jgi:CheY-like chemotaxis protein
MILVVAPAATSRRTIATALRRDGHEVLELPDATHLLARVLGRRSESPLIVADPGAGVSDVLELLRATAWRGPVVLMDRDTRGMRRLDQLRATVRRTLAARTA